METNWEWIQRAYLGMEQQAMREQVPVALPAS